MKIVVSSITAPLVLACFPVILGSQSQPLTQDAFPMEEGTSWVYRGTVRWYDFQSRKTVRTTVTSRVEVLRVIRRNDLGATVVRGFPSDFDWSDGQAIRNDWLFVRTRTGDLYLIGGEDVEKNLKRLENDKDSLKGMLSIDDLLMKLPPRKGMKFCDAEAKKRPDDRYCWVVASAREVNLNGISGVKAGLHTAFLLQYVTVSDDTELEFVPGIGFISYGYHHHGSVADTAMKLVEYHSSKNLETTPGLTR